jgi:hypothetical protein
VNALFIALLAIAPELDVEPIELTVIVVRDPELYPLEPELVSAALEHAKREYELRFGAASPRFVLAGDVSLSDFLLTHAVATDPACKPLYDARYRGGGPRELEQKKKEALAFFEKWPLESLRGFILEKDRPRIEKYEDIWSYYVSHYTRTVENMRALKTSAGTPLVEPDKSRLRSFAAWPCALRLQTKYDVVITNAFILADLMDEPHPHAVFGKGKVGGIATESPSRRALGGQALLATTFGIDTPLPQFRELPDGATSLEERAKILGAYLLAHEIAHAAFAIPDAFDHPPGCLMTSRPGATYRDGLAELEANPRPCPRCRPYVEARALSDRARRALAEKKHSRAHDLVAEALKKLPKQVHGSRKRRVAELLLVASQASRALGRRGQAIKYEELAMKLDPKSLTSSVRTSSTSTTTR